jgi:hypothetical protein
MNVAHKETNGYNPAAGPLQQESVIKTSTAGLTAGTVKIETRDIDFRDTLLILKIMPAAPFYW